MPQFEIKNGIAIIPKETTKVDDNAFESTSLESVVIPIGVTEIGEQAFKDCTSLTTVILTSFNVNIIGTSAFEGCSALTAIYVPAKKFYHYIHRFPMYLHDMIKPVNKDMEWDEAIQKVLADYGRPMHYIDILKEIIKHGYRLEYGKFPNTGVNSILSTNKKLFRSVSKNKGIYELAGTSATTLHSHKTVGGKDPVVVRPCVLNNPYKYESYFEAFTVPTVDEKELLKLIVNLRLPLEKDEVCFAEILDDIDVEFSNENKPRDQSPIDRSLLEDKREELNKQINKIRNKIRCNQEQDPNQELYSKLERMQCVVRKIDSLLDKHGNEVAVDAGSVLGEFIPGEKGVKPKVVIYYKTIESICRDRWKVMAGVFVHEMFHAWNYFKAGKNPRSVLAIDEPMVEFETLYFLKRLDDFTSSLSHDLHKKVEDVRIDCEYRVYKKQLSIGDVAAYGFGHHLFKNLNDVNSIKWIETYSKKSAFIKGSNPHVTEAEKYLIPVYPFQSEKDVMELFEKIIFDSRAIAVTAEKSDAPQTGSHVSLRDLVLACIETIGRKYFEAKELYAFAPIFKACMPHCPNIEEALKQELDELVREKILDTLSDDYYCVK